MQVSRDQPGALALRRGHLKRSFLSSAAVDLDVAHAPDADLDGEFEATCMETGGRLMVCGWLYERDAGMEADVVEAVDGSSPIHPVLKAAMNPDCPQAVAALLVDWSHRDAIDAMLDARLLKQAFETPGMDMATPEVSFGARRAFADWIRDFNHDERVGNAEKLVNICTEWADTVLNEAIAGGFTPNT